MLQEAEQFADKDRLRRERIDKRNRGQDLISQCDRKLREITLDFGPQFASNLRRRVETLSRDLQDSINRDQDRQIDLDYANLQDALYELNQEVNRINQEYYDDEEELFPIPSMSSISDAVSKGVNKGVELVTGRPSASSDSPPRRSPSRMNNDFWEDWDDDDDW